MTTFTTPILHVVPNGLQGRRVARVVLLLLPAEDAAQVAWGLESWPEHAHGFLDRLMGRDGAEPVEVEMISPTGTRIAKGTLRDPNPNRHSDSARIVKLWQSAVAGGWLDFLGAATKGQKMARRSLPLPSTEAAFLLPLERARANLTAMAPPTSPLHARKPLRPHLSTLSAHKRPWLGKPDELVRLAAMSTARMTDVGGYLSGPPDLEEWAEAYANGAIDPAHPFSKRLDPTSIARAALGDDGEDLLWLADRMHALHQASFYTVTSNPPPAPPTNAGGRRLHQLLSSPGLMRLFGWARDAFLDLDADLPEGRRAALVRPVKKQAPARHRTIATDLDPSRNGFFPAAVIDWPNLDSDDVARQRAGVAVLSVSKAVRFAVTSCETVAGVEEDRQSLGESIDGSAPLPRLVTGPLSLMFLDNSDELFPNTPDDGTARDVLYAEDLAAPLRLDLGIELENGALSWHSTSVRTVIHRDPNASDATREWPAKAIADFWPSWMPQQEREVAGVATLTFQQHQDGASGYGSRDTRVAAYFGEDLGAPPNQAPLTAGSGASAAWLKPVVKLGETGEDLLVSQHIAVSGNKSLPPLRFGWSYRFGLRRSFLGGAGPRLEDARAIYDHPDAHFPPAAEPAARYLRHEPVSKPVVMLAPRSPSTSAGDPQTAAQMQVGAVANSKGTTNVIAHTSRILLPPPVAFSFAELHDVFSSDEVGERGEIRIGLPMPPESVQVLSSGTVQVTAEPHAFKRLAVNAPRQGLVNAVLESEKAIPQAGKTGGNAEPIPRFRIRGIGEAREVRQIPYYPDPAACFLVLRLAHPDRPQWLTDEPPLVVRLRAGHGGAGGPRWPDVMPVRVDLVATNELRGRRLYADGVVEEQGPIADTGPFEGISPPAISVQSVTVRLAPGEQARLRAWLAPAADDLESWFDVLRCSSGLCEMEGKKRGKVKPEEACQAGIASLFGRPAFGGGDVPQLATLFHDHLLREPLPGLTEVHEMLLSHVFVRPRVSPKFLAGSERVVRPASFEPEVLRPFLTQAGPSRSWPTTLASDGATSVLPAGSVEFDPATTSGLVVEALIRAPGTDQLDKPARALPSQFVPEEPPALEFGLTADDRANLDHAPGSSDKPAPRWVKVLAVKNIPVPPDARAGAITLQLEEVLANRSKDFSGARLEFGAPLEQAQARQTVFRVLGIPRHGGGVGAAGPITRPLWIPSTARPAAPDPKDLSSLFRWTPVERTVEGGSLTVQGGRTSLLRLWLRRPWFTSGEGERLGIVIWPPQAFDLEGGQAAQLPFDVSALGELHDEDLGPLGRFVSVWGHDPIEGLASGKQRHRFLAREHFEGIDGDGSWQPHVLIPLAGMPDDPYSHTSRETMAAASLLCPPVRFASEVSGGTPQPYVDLDLNLPGVASPRLRLGLVRFQPNARPDVKLTSSDRAGIRCSAPSHIEGALLPRRWYSLKATLLTTRQAAGGVVTSVAVKLWGPTDGFDKNTLRQRVIVELMERRAHEEFPVQVLNTPRGMKNAVASWETGTNDSMGHVWADGISTWTAVFHVPGNLLSEARNVVASIREDLMLPSTSSSDDKRALPQFSATLSVRAT